jgi:translocation and assembly module TamB
MVRHREKGDLSFGSEIALDHGDRAFRVTAASLSARFADDAIDATATFRSERGLNADAQLAIGVVPNAPPGHLSADAPLRFTLNADLATLRVLQPWVGTTAIVDGNAHAELVARGTLARAPLSGTVRANAMRIEAPQYGVLFTDGHLAARLADGTLMLDELSFVGGAGRFTASGTLARTGAVTADGEGAAGQMTWRAEKFRVLNRPDVRLVVGGSGKVGLKNRKISLDGTLVADEGHFEYKPDLGATLGDDVVVKGWHARENGDTRRQSLPLSIDLELDLGTNLTFAAKDWKPDCAAKCT